MSKIKVNSIEAATGSTITIPSGQTLDISSTTLTLPSTVVTTTGTQTLTNKTIGVSQLTGTLPVANGGTGLTSLGTASQVLRVNSGATALEFGSVSSDYVLLATATASNTAATLSIDGYFSTTYTRYYLFGYGIFSSSNASDLKFNLNVSGSADTGSKYVQTNSYQYTDENSSHSIATQATASGGSIDMNAPGTTWVANADPQADDDATGSDCTLEIYNPYNNVRWKNVKWSHVFARADATTWQEFFGIGVFKETGYVSGVTVGVTAGNLTGTFKLYGVK